MVGDARNTFLGNGCIPLKRESKLKSYMSVVRFLLCVFLLLALITAALFSWRRYGVAVLMQAFTKLKTWLNILLALTFAITYRPDML